MNNQFSARLNSLRRAKGLTQSQLGELAGISSAVVSKYETGRTPPLDAAINIARALGVSLDYLCGLSNECQTDDNFTTHRDLLRLLFRLSKIAVVYSRAKKCTVRDDHLVLDGSYDFAFDMMYPDYDFRKKLVDFENLLSLCNSSAIGPDVVSAWIDKQVEPFMTPVL